MLESAFFSRIIFIGGLCCSKVVADETENPPWKINSERGRKREKREQRGLRDRRNGKPPRPFLSKYFLKDESTAVLLLALLYSSLAFSRLLSAYKHIYFALSSSL